MALTKPRAYQIYDIDYKQAVRVVTLANITLSGGAPNNVDSVNLSLNDRILVTGQSSAAQNGIYYVTTVGSGSNGTWARSVDTNTTGELLAGTIVMVTEGTVYADTQWKLITDDPITIGSTELTFIQNFQGPIIVNGTSNVGILSPNSNVTVGVNGTSNVVVFSATGVNVAGYVTSTGNISANYFVGNGSQLTGIAGGTQLTYGTTNLGIGTADGNANITISGTSNVAVFSAGGANISGYVTATGNITGSYILGNGSQLTGITGSGGGITWTTVANTAPSSPAPGDFWYNSYTGIKYQYTNDGTGNTWVDQSFPTTFTSITTNQILNGGTTGTGNIGTSVTTFNTIFAKATSAQYADLAEIYSADDNYSPGTVVVFGGEKEITISTFESDTRVAGVISTDPAFIMNSGIEGLQVALTGRVPCMVKGPVSKGDVLVTSDIPGTAQCLGSNWKPGCVIGKSLDNIESGLVKIIEVVVGRF